MEKQLQTQIEFNNKTIRCPICQSEQLETVIQLKDVPVLCNLIWTTRQEALNVQRGDIDLVLCSKCGHMFNEAFDPEKLTYDVQYENSLHYSTRFQEYATGLAQYLVNHYDLRGKSIIEIGSGKGDFLRMLCEYGGNAGTGFDPSYEPSDHEAHPAITFVRDLYTQRHADYMADLVLSRHVLEHIPQPLKFIQSLRRTIGQRKSTLVFFEVPNLSYILRDTAIWDIIYEHYSYFSSNSLSQVFSQSGFNVLKTTEAFEGQFLSIEALPRNVDRPAPNAPSARSLEVLIQQAAVFSRQSREKLANWQEKLHKTRSSGKRAVVWGAGSKGISFLNMLPVKEEIDHVIDINPRKHGKFITGAGQQIVPPEALKSIQPDTIIIMNPVYRSEIQNTLKQLEIEAEIFLAS